MIKCPSCGAGLPRSARFCRACGRPIAIAKVQPKSIKLPDGIYMGKMENGLPHGMGKLVSDEGKTVTYGLWKQGKLSDLAFVSSVDGCRVSLDVIGDDKVPGAMLDGDGRYVEGTLSKSGAESDHDFVGRVVGRDINGDYDCPWSDGGLTGKGTFRGVQGSSYEGGFENWKYCGRGVFRSEDGTVYEGEFIDGKLNDLLVCTLPSGLRFEFEGSCVDGHAEGQGACKGQGITYEGGWHEGLFHGKGRLVMSDWYYDGQFEKGLRSGTGVYSMSGGKYVYSGAWRKDMFHGEGHLKCADGSWRKGTWSNGEPSSGIFSDPTMSESFDWDKVPRPSKTPQILLRID